MYKMSSIKVHNLDKAIKKMVGDVEKTYPDVLDDMGKRMVTVAKSRVSVVTGKTKNSIEYSVVGDILYFGVRVSWGNILDKRPGRSRGFISHTLRDEVENISQIQRDFGRKLRG